jgi:hypothetical protein
VPGAIVDALFVDGTRIDTAKYEVLAQNTIIRWTPADQPQRAVASIKLTEELTLGKDTDRNRPLEETCHRSAGHGDRSGSINYRVRSRRFEIDLAAGACVASALYTLITAEPANQGASTRADQ